MESGLAIIKKCFDYFNSRRQNLKLFFPPALYLIVNVKHIIRLGVPLKVVSNVLYTIMLKCLTTLHVLMLRP